jgi:hypothetical protein
MRHRRSFDEIIFIPFSAEKKAAGRRPKCNYDALQTDNQHVSKIHIMTINQ